MMKTLIVYTHLLAACVAIGVLLIQDLALAKTKGKRLSPASIKELTQSANVMFIALIVLWISGLSLVVVGYLDDPAQYLMNEKLWAKFTVVAVLTLNGIALHFFSFPRIISPVGLVGAPAWEQIALVFTGALSTTSWLFACYLGIARPWNYSVDYSFIMSIYAGLLLGAFIVSGEVLRSMRKASFAAPNLAEGIPLSVAQKCD